MPAHRSSLWHCIAAPPIIDVLGCTSAKPVGLRRGAHMTDYLNAKAKPHIPVDMRFLANCIDIGMSFVAGSIPRRPRH